jgi:hypothetical protein
MPRASRKYSARRRRLRVGKGNHGEHGGGAEGVRCGLKRRNFVDALEIHVRANDQRIVGFESGGVEELDSLPGETHLDLDGRISEPAEGQELSVGQPVLSEEISEDVILEAAINGNFCLVGDARIPKKGPAVERSVKA